MGEEAAVVMSTGLKREGEAVDGGVKRAKLLDGSTGTGSAVEAGAGSGTATEGIEKPSGFAWAVAVVGKADGRWAWRVVDPATGEVKAEGEAASMGEARAVADGWPGARVWR